MSLLQVDPHSAVPVFEQLRVQLTDAIRTGELPAGTSLPTVRQLAADLDIAKNTVARAYQALETDGLVRGEGRHGTVVLGDRSVDSDSAQRLAAVTRRYLAELAAIGADADDAIAAIRRAAAPTTAH
jgi:DNA-binding transcriptional regulator YhcF (GntR family)